MAVSVFLWSGERHIVREADGAHIHGDFFVVTRRANETIATLLTLWATNVIYAEVRQQSGAIRIVRGGLLCPTCRQPVAVTDDASPTVFRCAACGRRWSSPAS